MKNNKKQFIILIVLGLLYLPQVAVSQSKSYTINEQKSNHIKLSGTSSLHDWEMNTNEFSGKAEFNLNQGGDHSLIGVNSLTFSLPATNLKSDKNAMDKNAYKALNTDKYKNIIYTLATAKVFPENSQKYLLKTTGNLIISGVTREVDMDVYCEVNKDESIHCSGTKALKMSDYKVEPPSFLFGAMKTGDEIKVDFNMVFTNNNIK